MRVLTTAYAVPETLAELPVDQAVDDRAASRVENGRPRQHDVQAGRNPVLDGLEDQVHSEVRHPRGDEDDEQRPDQFRHLVVLENGGPIGGQSPAQGQRRRSRKRVALLESALVRLDVSVDLAIGRHDRDAGEEKHGRGDEAGVGDGVLPQGDAHHLLPARPEVGPAEEWRRGDRERERPGHGDHGEGTTLAEDRLESGRVKDAPIATPAEHDQREHRLEQAHGAREAVEAAERVTESPPSHGEVRERSRDVEQALDDGRGGHVDNDEVGHSA